MIDSEIFSIITLIIMLIGLGYVYLTLQDCGVILDRMKENCKSMMKACDSATSDLGELDEIQKDLKRRNKKTKVK
jgi:hypothetical protein